MIVNDGMGLINMSGKSMLLGTDHFLDEEEDWAILKKNPAQRKRHAEKENRTRGAKGEKH